MIFPIIGVILKPLVRPVTNLYLDLSDEMAEAIEEREILQKSNKATAEPTGIPAAEKKAAKKPTWEEKAVEKEAAKAIIKGVAEII